MTVLAWYPPMWREALLLCLVVVLFLAYWFRRNVLAELKSQPPGEHVEAVCRANNLSFPEIEQRLGADASLEQWQNAGRALGREFKLLTFLLTHAGSVGQSRPTFTDRMLMADFRLMQASFWLTLRLANRPPRRALGEMVRILNRLADSLARRIHALRNRAAV
jgi:hypothetical protein